MVKQFPPYFVFFISMLLESLLNLVFEWYINTLGPLVDEKWNLMDNIKGLTISDQTLQTATTRSNDWLNRSCCTGFSELQTKGTQEVGLSGGFTGIIQGRRQED